MKKAAKAPTHILCLPVQGLVPVCPGSLRLGSVYSSCTVSKSNQPGVQVDDFRHSQIDWSTAVGEGEREQDNPPNPVTGLWVGNLGKVYIQLRGESRQKFKLYKKITHIEIELG